MNEWIQNAPEDLRKIFLVDQFQKNWLKVLRTIEITSFTWSWILITATISQLHIFFNSNYFILQG